ncbi:hypothetical protein Q3G72_012663 [Acer saccharum]|nr:hypothetical protein Q3G72_012663 [Acer saccharum]
MHHPSAIVMLPLANRDRCNRRMVLSDRLAHRDLSFFPRPEVVLPELQKRKKKLLKMEAVLADAEEK